MAGSVVFVVFLFLSMTTFSPANWLTLAMYRFLVLCHVVSFMLFFSALVSATLRRRWRFLIHWGGRGVGKEVGSSCLLGAGEGLPGEGFSCSEDLLDRTGPAVPGRGVKARELAFCCIGGAEDSGGLFLDCLGVKALSRRLCEVFLLMVSSVCLFCSLICFMCLSLMRVFFSSSSI